MLRAERRLTDGSSFGLAVRRGRRAGSRTVVVHVLDPGPSGEVGADPAIRGAAAVTCDPAVSTPTRIGFVVSRAVGNAVVRNRVRRRLRHLVAARYAALPTGTDVVVRALPAAAATDAAGLGRDLDHCLARLDVAASS